MRILRAVWRVGIVLFAGRALPAGAAPVTFNHDVGPLLYRHCSACHRPGEAAPFALLSYENALRKAKAIADVTASRTMPPWKAEPASYPYREDRRLTDAEVALIGAWVSQGTPEGDPAERPEPPKFPSGWRLGEPDLVVEMPEAYPIPAEGPDIYRNLATPLKLPEDRWVTAIDMHPSARSAVHHVLYFADPQGRLHERRQGDTPGFSGMRAGGASVPLGGWAVGGQPHFYPEGLALRLPAGSDLVVQYHFHPTGKAEREKSTLALYFAKAPPKRTLMRVQMPPAYSLFAGLDIPAGEKDFVVRDAYVLPVAVDGVGVGAHAHYLGKAMTMTATLPDGAVKTLLKIGDWDFAWQDRYFFSEFVPLPRGTRLEVEIHWDNSADNPRNPSRPPVRAVWGEESKDEMGAVSLIAVAHDEADAPRLAGELERRRRELARGAMRADPELARKVMKLLAE